MRETCKPRAEGLDLDGGADAGEIATVQQNVALRDNDRFILLDDLARVRIADHDEPYGTRRLLCIADDRLAESRDRNRRRRPALHRKDQVFPCTCRVLRVGLSRYLGNLI